jgi:UDP-2,3-diacylglucosamine hydrolase
MTTRGRNSGCGPEDLKGTIGIIAGGGNFPLMVGRAARAQGLRVAAVAHHGETDPAISECVDAIAWIRLGQLGHLVSALKKMGVARAVMAGTITKRRMFEKVRPDLKGLALMSRLAMLQDDHILRAVAEELGKSGIEVVSSTVCVPGLAAEAGCLTRRRPRRREDQDIRFGWTMAKALGQLDIGQCVVVRRRTVLAVEAIEGTDETICRGGRLAGAEAVVVKVSKPGQDLRFDVPAVGLGTIKTMAEAHCSALAVEAGKTLIFDRAEMIALADDSGITVVSRPNND